MHVLAAPGYLMALLCQELTSLSLSFVSVQNNESDVDHHESLLPTTYKKKKNHY